MRTAHIKLQDEMGSSRATEEAQRAELREGTARGSRDGAVIRSLQQREATLLSQLTGALLDTANHGACWKFSPKCKGHCGFVQIHLVHLITLNFYLEENTHDRRFCQGNRGSVIGLLMKSSNGNESYRRGERMKNAFENHAFDCCCRSKKAE